MNGSLYSFSTGSNSLDDQYLAFREKTQEVFDNYPQLAPLRQYIFKDLLIKGLRPSFSEVVKHVLRPIRSYRQTTGHLQPADVMIWLENEREVVVDTLLPVEFALRSQGVHTAVFSFNKLKSSSVSVVNFEYPARVFPPAWANMAWRSLTQVEPNLKRWDTEVLVKIACAMGQSLLCEMERLLDLVQPQLVVTASTNMMGGAALTVVAQQRGIPTIVLQHGIVQVFYTPIVADYIFTWGKTSNDTLVRLGVPAQQIVTVGSPRHDRIGPGNGTEARCTFLNALGLPDLSTFVFFSNGNDFVRNGEAPVICAQWLESLACEFEGRMNIVVRLHPNEDGSLYKECPHLYLTKNTVSLSTTLEGCDWSGSFCSSVLNEAILYRKPVWQFYADDWPDLAENWRDGLAERVSSFDNLRQKTNDFLTFPFTHKSDLVEQVFANHGHATLAVATHLQEIIKTHERPS